MKFTVRYDNDREFTYNWWRPTTNIEGVLRSPSGSGGVTQGTTPSEPTTSTDADNVIGLPVDRDGTLLDLGDIVESRTGLQGTFTSRRPDGKIGVRLAGGGLRYWTPSNVVMKKRPSVLTPVNRTGGRGTPTSGEFGEWGDRAADILAARDRTGELSLETLFRDGESALGDFGLTGQEYFNEVWGVGHEYTDSNGNQQRMFSDVSSVYFERGYITVKGSVYDGSGNAVGDFTRKIKNQNGKISIYHAIFTLNDSYQGKGFGTVK